jgi:gas vesicle protein
MRFILGFLIGLIVGASIALAFAPQPGTETRQKVWEQVKERASRQGGEQE